MLLQEVRQAQQDVHDERLKSDLRLEIMSVQEDVRRESESEASSSHSPLEYFSQASSSRYQVATVIPTSGHPFLCRYHDLPQSQEGNAI